MCHKAEAGFNPHPLDKMRAKPGFGRYTTCIGISTHK